MAVQAEQTSTSFIASNSVENEVTLQISPVKIIGRKFAPKQWVSAWLSISDRHTFPGTVEYLILGLYRDCAAMLLLCEVVSCRTARSFQDEPLPRPILGGLGFWSVFVDVPLLISFVVLDAVAAATPRAIPFSTRVEISD